MRCRGNGATFPNWVEQRQFTEYCTRLEDLVTAPTTTVKTNATFHEVKNFCSRSLFIMDNNTKMPTPTSLFQVYLRLRPPIDPPQPKQKHESWLIVEPARHQNEDAHDSFATHVTLQPPNDSRKRAIERFGFTKIFDEAASQLDVFQETGTADTIKTLLQTGRDGLVATLGVTGSGKVRFMDKRWYQWLIVLAEPYHTRVKVAERFDANDPRCAFQINRTKYTASGTHRHSTLVINTGIRCLGGSNPISNNLPGISIWRQRSRQTVKSSDTHVESANPHDGRQS